MHVNPVLIIDIFDYLHSRFDFKIFHLQYLGDIKTKLSVVYIETWATKDQMDVSKNVRETLLNFVSYISKKVYKVKRDNAQMLT